MEKLLWIFFSISFTWYKKFNLVTNNSYQSYEGSAYNSGMEVLKVSNRANEIVNLDEFQ